MLRHYLTVALRTLAKRRGYAVANVAGLSVGLACCALVVLFAREELGYDRFHERADDVVRLTTQLRDDALAESPRLYTDPVREAVPEIEYLARFTRWQNTYGIAGNRRFRETRVLLTDTGRDLFAVFPFSFRRGDPAAALAQPGSVVLSEEAAARYFGDADPLGQVLRLDALDLTVTGVLAPLPSNVHVAFDFWVRPDSLPPGDWAYQYALLHPDADRAAVEARLDGLTTRLRPEHHPETSLSLGLQPVTEIHLDSALLGELEPGGSRAYLYAFGLIGLVALLISCANYVLLALAVHTQRAHEAGVRRALGAHPYQVRRQLLAEAAVLALLCVPLVLGLVGLGLPRLNALMGTALRHDFLTEPSLLLGLVAVALGVGLAVGLYPAHAVAARAPTHLLTHGLYTSRRSGRWLQHGLVLAQLTLLLGLGTSAYLVDRQLAFVGERDLGFEADDVFHLRGWVLASSGTLDAFTNDLRSRPSVRAVAPVGRVPGMDAAALRLRDETGTHTVSASVVTGDPGFFEILGVEGLAGAYFRLPVESRPDSVVLASETLAARLGYADPVGRDLIFEDGTRRSIGGVFRDLHFTSLHERIEPLAFLSVRGAGIGTMAVRATPGRLADALRAAETAWTHHLPDEPFRYAVLRDDLDALYQTEARLATLTKALSLVGILLAAFGTVSLASFQIRRRRRELAIRRVFGASVQRLLGLLTRDFAALVGLAAVLAAPLTHLGVGRWLEGFAYHIALGPLPLLIAPLVAFGGVLLVVGAHLLRAATADPVKALRHE